jgi:hypothetical protein
MKKITQILGLFIIVLSLNSCEKDTLSFDFPLPDKDVCLPPNLYYGPEQYFTFTVTNADLNAAATVAKLDLNTLKSAKLTKATIEVTSTGLTLDEIQNVSLYARATGLGTPTSSNKGMQVAYTGTIAAGATSINLELNGTQLLSLFENNKDAEFVIEVLNKDRTSTGGTPQVCIKMKNATLGLSN